MQRDEYVGTCPSTAGYRGVSGTAIQPTRRRGCMPTIVDMHDRVLRADLVHPLHAEMHRSTNRLPDTCLDWRLEFLEAREAAGVTNGGSWL